MRKKVIFILFVLIIGTFPISVMAKEQSLPVIASTTLSPTPIEYAMPYPGILPDNPLYSLKVLRDRILLFFTKDDVKKVHLKLILSDKRTVMGQLLWEKGNYNLSIDTLTKGEKYILEAAISVSDLKKKNNLPPGLRDKVELAIKKHEEIISKIIFQAEDETSKKRLKDALGVNHQAGEQITSFK